MKSMEIRRENRYDSAIIMRQVLKTALVRAKERLKSELGSDAAAAEFLGIKENKRIETDDQLLELDAPEVSFPPDSADEDEVLETVQSPHKIRQNFRKDGFGIGQQRSSVV